jgi:hypothetical protein
MKIKKVVVNEIDYCCTQMKEAIENKAILTFPEQKNDISIKLRGPFTSGKPPYLVEIEFCPFCGKVVREA